jgi:hypothetical protein
VLTGGWSFVPRYCALERWDVPPRVSTSGSARVDLGPPLTLTVGDAAGTAQVFLTRPTPRAWFPALVTVDGEFDADIRGRAYARLGAVGVTDAGEELWFAPHEAVGAASSGRWSGRATLAAAPGATSTSAFAHLQGANATMTVHRWSAHTAALSPIWLAGAVTLGVAWAVWVVTAAAALWRSGRRATALAAMLFAVGLVVPAVWKNAWHRSWPLDGLLTLEKSAHLGFFALLGASIGPTVGPWALIGVAVCTEAMQILTLDRDPMPSDLVIDAVGMMIGVAVGNWATARRPPSAGR